MVSSHHHRNDLKGQRVTMKVIGGSEEIPLSVIRLYRMEVPAIGALDMNGSLHLTIGFLLKNEYGGLGV